MSPALLSLCGEIKLEEGGFQGKPTAEARAECPQHTREEAQPVIEFPKPMREETEPTRELVELMQTPGGTERLFAELVFLSAKRCSWRSKQTRERPKPTREPSKQRFVLPELYSELPKQWSALPEYRSRQMDVPRNVSRAPETFPCVRQLECGLPAKPSKRVSRQSEPR
jgi:hypothetical protein